MRRLQSVTAVALVSALAVAPAAAQQQQQQNAQNQNQQNQQQGPLVKPQLSEQGQACVERLEQVDRQLAEFGYGRPGPQGYGVYGTAYAPSVAPDAALTRPLQATPRADMQALMRAGYVMARTGHDQGCQQVAAAVEDISQRYQQALESGEFDRAGMAQWRETFLAAAVPVTELEQPLRADQIIGGDLRNPRDEDLGDIEDVVFGPDGEIRYVIVQRGGFLGFGDEEVAVPWSELQVTAAPYRDTFVLDVSEQALEEAPTVDRQQLATGGEDGRIESFWDQQLNENQQQ